MSSKLLWIGAAALAMAGCADSDADDAAETEAATAEVIGEAAGGDPHGEESGANILLAADGIMLAGTQDSMVEFGANSLDAIEQAIPVFGETYDYDESTECGAGPMEFANWGPIVLMTMNGEFVGWELRESQEEPWIGTPGGVTIGSPRSDLEAAIEGPVRVEETSLGTEFNGGGFTGLLSSEASDATVTALWAGTNCVMR